MLILKRLLGGHRLGPRDVDEAIVSRDYFVKETTGRGEA
jgi:hypothetical protein